MINRAIRICSTYNLLSNELDEIRRITKLNGYPRTFVDTLIGVLLNKMLVSNHYTAVNNIKKDNSKKIRLIVDVPFVKNSSKVLSKKLTYLTKTIKSECDLKIIMRPPKSIGSFFQVKDNIPNLLESNLVYAVNCNDCSGSYCGKTERQVCRRLVEHGAPKCVLEPSSASAPTQSLSGPLKKTKTGVTSYSNATNLRRFSRIANKNKNNLTTVSNLSLSDDYDSTSDTMTVKQNKSAISKHISDTRHKINWDGFKILFKDNNPYRLLIKESLAILSHKPKLNNTVRSIPLFIFPEGIRKNLIKDPGG
ncbi:unnamed protein product [Didymodactylos carnosus]|uniref:Helix-turn-helix domain-containing protein n=1 Tax=Didymodactylos carnosus TaxID=1234261 RepID=A0A814JN38_9BILA|nr:unnamed protein product [Didymodactylos carnosus]CAF3811689.1 unnamed protein product [Didymodactylos carnosus]